MANQVWVEVVGGGGAYFDADASGNGSGAFQIDVAPGNYILQATDNFGNSAQANFTVGVGWTVLTPVAVTIGITPDWVILTPITTTLTATNWQILTPIETTLLATSWTILTPIETMLLATSWAILTPVNVLLGVTNWTILTPIEGTVDAGPGEGGIPMWVWFVVGGVAVVTVLVIALKSSGGKTIKFVEEHPEILKLAAAAA
jgi:hypothetical protein